MNTYSIVFLSLENPNNYNWFGQSYKTSLEHKKKKLTFYPEHVLIHWNRNPHEVEKDITDYLSYMHYKNLI